MDAALIASAALLGLAGAPHCTAMCAAPCTAIVGAGGARAQAAFHTARVASYAMAGAVVAASAGALAGLAQWSPVLRPLWTLLQVAALGLGLWLLWQGRQPAWLGAVGLAGRREPPREPAPPALVAWAPAAALGWRADAPATGATATSAAAAATPRAGAAWPALRAAGAGALWVGWPCGLLHSALLVAAMTQGPAAGAGAMAAFALASSLGLVWAPWLWRRLGAAGSRRAEAWAARLAGAMLVAAAGFALGHGLWHPIAVYCGWA